MSTVPGITLEEVRILRLPSVGGPNFDMFAIIPVTMDAEAASNLAAQSIMRANQELAENDNGTCDDGLTVSESIQQELSMYGFSFLSQENGRLIETMAWDAEYVGEIDRSSPSQG